MPDARPIIRLSEPARAGTEADLVREVLDGAIWHGDGPMTQRATHWLRERLGAPGALMTSSCTPALDMAARLIGLGPGDEAIVPSFTFPSTATAVALTVSPSRVALSSTCARTGIVLFLSAMPWTR